MALDNTTNSLIPVIRGLIHDKKQNDGRDSFVFKTDSVFHISEDFADSSTITVFKNTDELSDSDWSYDSDNNEVTVTPVSSGVSLEKNDVILITYSYYQKYSDAEILGYLESALSYFVQYKYKKTFEVSSDDKIITVNGVNPTKNELYIIALVTSVLIDPQNIETNIPDLRLSANREKSDQDQIKDIFINFKRFLGTVDLYNLDQSDGGTL